MDSVDNNLILSLAARLRHRVEEVERAYISAARNIRTVLRRQSINTSHPTPDRPVCKFVGEEQLFKCLGIFSVADALFTLARIYDEAHVALCKAIAAARRGRIHNEGFRRDPYIDLRVLTDQLHEADKAVEGQIVLHTSLGNDSRLTATFQPLEPMSFDNLQRLSSLADLLPGETTFSLNYAGIGSGGGSDIISASLLGHLLRTFSKTMSLLISTRPLAIGSRDEKSSKLMIKREVYNHGGHATTYGRPVPGTFRITEYTSAEGCNLETIPLPYYAQIFMVLDQDRSRLEIPDDDKADLTDQFYAVLNQSMDPINTVLIVDTGGGVFGAATNGGGTTPRQGFRVQKAISPLSPEYNLVTAVMAPGLDAPHDAPETALKAGGVVYRPTGDEKRMLLDVLANRYKMDGSDPSRISKAMLALRARLRGVVGWTSLDLPAAIVDTWDNPWSSFVYIRECLSDIIFMPTTKLLPLIEPLDGEGTNLSPVVEPLEGKKYSSMVWRRQPRGFLDLWIAIESKGIS
ncbi:uncharacterized protein PV07_09764 [Cladophialophora immunda]|uniref:Uncharacterized protein n=1 Tax=Cladophialophora immunda TaxID=569365 RepID=A0A0D2C0N3_9EURO|nr:uncharacterized protein PV07_09764 [Cladophialophora immunda]KIW24025.1 hypothetical protein PV07_09764 [Cladophialophora immunda]